eukprot:857418-Pleurochrysis_carterae.AAC.2
MARRAQPGAQQREQRSQQVWQQSLPLPQLAHLRAAALRARIAAVDGVPRQRRTQHARRAQQLHDCLGGRHGRGCGGEGRRRKRRRERGRGRGRRVGARALGADKLLQAGADRVWAQHVEGRVVGVVGAQLRHSAYELVPGGGGRQRRRAEEHSQRLADALGHLTHRLRKPEDGERACPQMVLPRHGEQLVVAQ